MYKNYIPNGQRGFTLVELVVVFISIGLIISGILTGRGLIESARINAAITEVQQIVTASKSFADTYNYLPGDMPTPSLLSDCTDAPCTFAGDGNDFLSRRPHQKEIPDSETTAFWAHLSAVRLYTATEPNNGISGTTWGSLSLDDIIGVTHPKTPLGGVWQVGYQSGSLSNIASASGGMNEPSHYLALKTRPDFAIGHSGTEPPLTPRQAQRIDNKMDDGRPGNGTVLAAEKASGDCVDDDEYLVDLEEKLCALYFQVTLEVSRF